MHTRVRSLPVRQTIEITTRPAVPVHPTARPSLLIIDPDEVFLQLIKHALSRDYIVLTAHDPVEAAKIIQRGCFDLLLVDLSMPLRDGIGLLERTRTHPSLKETPVLVLSTSPALRKYLSDTDVVGILPKARWLDDLSHAISESIRISGEQEPAPRSAEPSVRRSHTAWPEPALSL